jgi:predicted  nucleic acid-binding Zn-ribbon protein
MVEPAGNDPRVAQLESDNEALRREVVDARHSLLVNRDHVVGTEAEIGRLNRDILRMQTELVASRKRIRALQNRKKGLITRTRDLEAKLKAARTRNQQLREELDRQVAARVPLSRRVVRRLRGRG